MRTTGQGPELFTTIQQKLCTSRWIVYTGFIFASLQLFRMEINDCNLHWCSLLFYIHSCMFFKLFKKRKRCRELFEAIRDLYVSKYIGPWSSIRFYYNFQFYQYYIWSSYKSLWINNIWQPTLLIHFRFMWNK